MSDNEPKFGELKEKRMRDIWRHEAHNFTPWLARNIRALGEALDLNLRAKQTEAPVGGYSLDLLAEEEDTGRIAAIENQFNQTDHSHLGQLLTYAAGCDADIVVWITEHVRDEHRAAVEWLNRKTDTETDFYLVAVKILQISDSLPAYQFVPVVFSNKWQKTQHQKAMEPSPEDKKTGDYFNLFAAVLQDKEFPYESRRNMHHAGNKRRGYLSGVRSWSYIHEIRYGYASVYLAFDYEYKASADKLRAALVKRKSAITKRVSLDLAGDDSPWNQSGWHYQRIGCAYRKCSFADDEETLAKIRAWAVDNILKLAEAVPPEMLREIADELEKENGGE